MASMSGESASSWQAVHLSSPFRTRLWVVDTAFVGCRLLSAAGESAAIADGMTPMMPIKAVRVNKCLTRFILYSPIYQAVHMTNLAY
jgi:hypothetical protein